MAKLIDVINELRTALQNDLGWTVQLSTDYRLDQDVIAPGVTAYQLRHNHRTAVADANKRYPVAQIEIVAFHQLLNPFDERTEYTENEMHTEQDTLLDTAWWKANIPSVRDITNLDDVGVSIEQETSREGHVISWSVLAIFSIVPD